MPDFIDQVFAEAGQKNEAGFVDASREELLQQLTPQEDPQQSTLTQKASAPQTEPGRIAGQNVAQRGGMDAIQGAMKWVDENIGIPVEDLVDNVFQGDKRTPDQIAKDRAARDQSLAEQLGQQKTIDDLPGPLKHQAQGLREVGGVIAGGMTGAAETVLNTAEIAGDSVRYLANLGNVREDQNPLSSKYEWASWDLGKDDAGAQTGVGKVAQGFLEFGILMAGTGGFSNLPGAATKFAAATTKLGKLGVVAKAGFHGARSGLAADMMSATRGEGNLSNLIKEHAPEWYPTFLTALAIDEDDSPWEAMLKTGLEGMGIGGAADSLGAFIGGSREARRILKAGGSEEEAAQGAVEAAEDILARTTPDSSGPIIPTKPTSPEEYVQSLEATKASDPTQYWSVDGVDLDTATKGRVISVDGGSGLVGPDGDIKGVFKDPTSTRKGVADDILQAAVRQGGIKLDNFDGYLTKIYERNGFRQVGRVPFNAEFAPPGWDEALHGRPDVVAMIYDPKGIVDLGDKARKFTDYDEMISHRDSFLESYPQLRSAKDQLAQGDVARITTPLPNGNRVEWRLDVDPDVPVAYKLPEGTKALSVTWKMGGGEELIQNHGRRIYSDFQRIAREELEPGTVVFNSPARDSYGRGASPAQIRRGADSNIRAQLYTRAGFGPVNAEGIQAAIVRNSPDGSGRWLQPVTDFDNPERLIEAINSQRHYLKRADDMLQTLPRQDAVNDIAARTNQETYENLARQDGGGRSIDQVRQDYAIEHYGRDPWGSMDNTGYQSARIREAQQAGYQADPRRAALESLISQAQKGIPVTWDDAAAVVPELFSRGARQVDEFNPAVLREAQYLRPDSPVILDPVTGLNPSGFAVDIDFKSLDDLTPDGIADFLSRNRDVLSREDVALKLSIDDQGKKAVELVRIVADETEARFLANLFDQPAIRDAGIGREFLIGGGDSLRGTAGNHIGTQFGTPMASRTVDSTTAIGQQIAARQNPLGVRGGSQPTITRQQLRRIARDVGDGPGDLLRRMVRENPVDLDTLSSVSRQTPDEVATDALKGIQEALGGAGELDFTKILTQAVGEDELLTRAGIVQVRGLMQELSTRLYESSFNIMKLGEANLDAFPQVQRMSEELKALMRIHKHSANAYSRYLSTYKIKVPGLGIEIPNPIKAPSDEQIAREIKNADKVLDDLVSKLASGEPKARAEAMRIANALVFTEGDPSKMLPLWRYIGQIAGGKGLNIFYNSMLSSPKTHEINLLSNAINTVYRPLAAAGGGNATIKKAAAASFHGFHKTLGESFSMAAKAMKDGPINDGAKTLLANSEMNEKLKLLQRSAAMSDDIGFKAAVGFASTIKNISDFPLFSWPSTLLTGSDELFKTMVARMEYNSQTMLKAIDASQGTDKPLQEIFERMLKDNVDDAFDTATGAIKDDSLLAAAKDVTFQTDLEGWAKSFGEFVNAVPPLRIFFPFVKTGHNIMVYAGTHVPVLNRFLSEYKTVMEGTDEYAKAVMKGREAYGRMIVIAGGMAAMNGAVTGNGPPDPQERKVWLMSNQQRSLNLTKLSLGQIKGECGKDRFLDYSRIEPFGQILSGAADVVDMFNAGRLSEDRAQYLLGYLTYAIAANFTNKSYMQGVVPLGQALTPGWQGLNTLATLPAEALNNFIPLAGARRTLANLQTPYQQEFNSQFDRLLYNASFGLAKTGSPMYDNITGEKVPALSGGGNALMPLAVTDRGGNVVKDALEDIEFDNSFIVKSLSGIKLDREHRSRLQQLMGSGAMQKELKAWVTHKNFKPAVEAFQARLRAGERVHKENEFFYTEITKIMTKHRDFAVQQLKTEFPELQAQVLDAKAIRTEQRRAGTETDTIDFEHLVNMPLR